MTSTEEKVATRYVKAAFFEVGDIIYYGKYKNKAGKILNFGKNEKGQPTVEIEPIPKGRKQNKTMGLFKIWKQRNVKKTAENVALRVINAEISSRIASKYLVAYAEKEGRAVLKSHETFVKAAELLKRKHTDFERARRRSRKRAEQGKEVERILTLTRDIVENYYKLMGNFIVSFVPRNKEKDNQYTRLKAQWNSWKKQIQEFIDSANKYLKAGDPEEYFWPVGLVDEVRNLTGSLAHSAFQLTVPVLEEPEVHENENDINKLRSFATGKVVGMARKFVGELGRDKQRVYNFVVELLTDVNMHKVATKVGRAFRYDPDDKVASEVAMKAGKMVSWNPMHAIGLAYATLKAVGDMSKGEVLLDAAADDSFIKRVLSKSP